jgi:hypothetical protein
MLAIEREFLLVSDADALHELERLAAVEDFKSSDYYLAWAHEVDGYLPYSSRQFQQAFRNQLRILEDEYEDAANHRAAMERIDEIVDEAIAFLKGED